MAQATIDMLWNVPFIKLKKEDMDMFNLEVNSIETINAGSLSVGEFAIIEEQDSSHNGELICRIYTPDNTVVFQKGEAMFSQQMPKTEMDELLDFYFSKKHATWLKNHTDRERIFFKGREYTECVESKQLPMSSSLYDDLIFIGIGTLKDIKIGE